LSTQAVQDSDIWIFSNVIYSMLWVVFFAFLSNVKDSTI
jgi:hypothetical protein